MEISRILIIFKTHLDIGFTDLASVVTGKYMNKFIPSAIQIASELRESGTPARMKWTTGSWLVYEYLRRYSGTAEEKALEDAIKRGDICWHGLPCTTHTELMDRELFEYGLSLSRRLDVRFGKTTRAAKMTDVPGHSKAMIPLMRKAGIDFIHIGVNEASAVPDVPGLFRWQCDSGEFINVMYEGSYGSFREIGNTGTAVVFAHTNDNLGCQPASEIIRLFSELSDKYPGADIQAATLDDVADAVREIQDALPVVTDEIGDSWIHGVGSDPTKTRTFRALEQVMESLPEGEDKETLAAGLLLVPEHTWGCDEKTWLHDNIHYRREETDSLMDEPDYRKMIASWREQRAFMSDAVSKLGPEAKKLAESALDKIKTADVTVENKAVIAPYEKISLGSFVLSFDGSGKCIYLSKGGRIIADESHPVLSLVYEKFGSEDYDRFYSQYNRLDVEWAREDFRKIGMESASVKHREYIPHAEIYAGGNSITIISRFSGEEHSEFGAPAVFYTEITAENDKIGIRLQWKDKPATRVAEAIRLGFNPIAENKRISKLGVLIDPCNVVSRGGRRLHATDRGVFWNNLSVESRDAVLVAPASPSLLDFNNIPVRDEESVSFILYDNIWGTNFPMWFGEDALFRFEINTEE